MCPVASTSDEPAAPRVGTGPPGWRGLPWLCFRELRRRVALLSVHSRWRDPALYGHPLVSDDFWFLAGRWRSYCERVAPARIHPLLGWTQGPLEPGNPLGLEPWTVRRLARDGRPKLLFYGDSYVGGHSRPEFWLPALLEERLEGADVLHLGVGGYGPDQMHLLLRETAGLVDRPVLVLMGIMCMSYDRVAQTVRSYQKPRFVLREDGELALTNVPIWRSPWLYYALKGPSFRSYVRAAERQYAMPDAHEDFGFESKVELNRAIIAANARSAREVGAKLLYVIFHDHEHLFLDTRRRRFFVEELSRQGIDFLDTSEALVQHARRHGTDASELYVDGHHNELGNQVIAEALVRAVERQGIALRPEKVSA